MGRGCCSATSKKRECSSGSDSGSGSRKTSRSTSSKLVLGTSGLVGVASAVSW